MDFPGSLVVRALDCGPKGRRFEPDPGRNGFFILRGLVLRSYSGLPMTPARWRWERCRKYMQRPLFHFKISVLGINSFPPIMGGNEFIPSTGLAMTEIFT